MIPMCSSCYVNLFRPSSMMQTHYTYVHCDYIRRKDPAISWQFKSGYSYQYPNFSKCQRSRRRTRCLLQMTNQRQQGNDRSDNNDKDHPKKIERRRDPTNISFLEKLVDKGLLLDTSSSNSESSFPTILIVLAIIAASLTIFPNTTSQIWFIGLFGLFSFLSIYQDPSRLLWDDELDDVTANGDSNRTLEDEEDDELNIYTLSFAYLAALSVAGILAPLDFEIVGVTRSVASFSLPTGTSILLVAVVVFGMISASGLLPVPHLLSEKFDEKNLEKEFDVVDDNDSLSKSAEERLMDLWDEQLKREQEPDGRDD